MSNDHSIRRISRREVYRNRWGRFFEDAIERDGDANGGGERGIYAVLEKDPSAIVIPLERTGEGEFLYLIEQFRYTVGRRFVEFPQGSWERADVAPEELARGELREETGLSAGRMTRLGEHWIAYGAMRQNQHIYLAEELTQGETDRDAEEHDLVVRRVSVVEFERMILDGTVMDNCSVAAWGLYKIWREQKKN